MLEKFKRKDATVEVRESGYDIKQEAKVLEDKYKELLEKAL